MKVYVKNSGQYPLTFAAIETVPVKDVSGRESLANRQLFARVFGVKKSDPVTGLIQHTGYTEIDQDDYDLILKTNKQFQSALVKGTLKKFDSPPDEALLDSQLLVRTQEENARLKAEVKRLEDLIRKGGSDEDKPKTSKKSKDKEPEL